jgi:flagellar hook-associated protein 2
MNLAVDGLVSGLDTTGLINSLMQVEAAPQTLLKKKSDAAGAMVAALQALNTKVAALATTAATAAEASSWQATSVTSTSSAVTATATAGALPATLQLRVDQVSAGQVSMIDLATADLGVPPTLTIVRGGELVTVSAAGDADDVAAAVNAAGAGVTAVPVRVTGGGTPEYRLQLSGAPGAGEAFAVYAGDEATVLTYLDATPDGYVDNGTAPPGARLASAATALVAARDAEVTLWPTAAAPITVTSATNTFDGVLPGVSFTVTAPTNAEPEPVTLTVTADAGARRALVADTVSSLSTVLADIAARTATTSSTAGGRTVVAGGLFSGDPTVRFLQDRLRAAAADPVGGLSPSTIGITIDRWGAVSFDAARFDAAMAADPTGTQAMAVAVAQRVADVAEAASDSGDGSLTLRLTSERGVVSDLTRQIEEWDRRLTLRRAGLERTYAALEVTLANLRSQSSWLAGQLATLPTSEG